MKTYRVAWCRRDIAGGLAPLVAMAWSIALPIAGADAADLIDGFTEPYRSIEIASAEMGIIASIPIREGETVKRGQVLAKLDQDILAAQLAIAEKAMQARGVIESALSELRLRQRRLEKLRQLQAKGHAGESEVARALADFDIAEAQVLSAKEQLVIRRLEYEKVRVQMEHRTIRAPTDGVIAAIYKEEGEFVATTEPFIMTLVQLDPMLAVFSVTSQQRSSFRSGDIVKLQLAVSGPKDVKWTSVEGEVEFVSPITEAESGTVLVKVRVPNPKHVYRTGERCSVLMPVEGADKHRTRFTGTQ